MNGEKVADPKELARKIALLGPKTSAELTILRNGEEQKITVKLGEQAGEKQAKANSQVQSSGPTELAKLGLSVEPARSGHEGVTVSEVDPDGLAGQKGLQAGDVILDAGGKPVTSAADITAAFDAAKASGHKSVLLRVKSGDNFRYVALSAQAS